MSRVMQVLLVGLVTAASGCADGGSDPVTDLQVKIDTLGGTVSVHIAGSPPEWGLEPVLRIGTEAGGPEEFGRIRSLTADADGNIYVADNLAHTIRVFAADGRHMRSMGGRGQGPGEFADLYSLAWLGDGLAAMDPGNARISIFSREGEVLEAIRHFPMTGPASLIRLHPLHVDGFYAPVINAAGQGLPWVRITPSGAQDTIPSPPRPSEARSAVAVCPRPDGAITFISLPEGPELVYGFPPPGGMVAASWTEEYRIVFLSPEGDTLRTSVRERPRAVYPDSLWDEGMRPYRELQESFPGIRCDPPVPGRPRHRAVLRHLLFDDAGRLWVEVAAESGFVWEVFDAEARLLGAAEAPPRVSGIPPYVRGGHLYQVEADDLGVQYVGVYRIVEGP